MKILFIIDSLGAGGAERSLQELLPWLSEHRIEPVVACFHRRSDGVENSVVGRVDVRSLDGLSRPAQVRALRRIAVHERVDLIHTTLFEAAVFGRPAFVGTGVPILTSLVTMPFDASKIRHDPHLNAVKLNAVRALEVGTGWLFADHFHAITQAVKDAAVDKLLIPPTRISVVHRGRDRQRLGLPSAERRAAVRARLGLSNDEFVFLVAARGDVPKGVSFAISAFGRAQSQHRRLALIWAGRDGNAHRAIDSAIATLPPGCRLLRLGHRHDVPDLMVAADVYVLPSLWEGLGCVVLEAMALDLPIIASDLPAVREVLHDDAWFVPPADDAALSARMLELARNPSLSPLVAGRARERFESSFTLEKSARSMIELFERVAAQR